MFSVRSQQKFQSEPKAMVEPLAMSKWRADTRVDGVDDT
jgi:hypothetical protein